MNDRPSSSKHLLTVGNNWTTLYPISITEMGTVCIAKTLKLQEVRTHIEHVNFNREISIRKHFPM